MIRVFISQPMRDKTDEEIMAAREEAVASVKRHFSGQDVEVIDSFLRGAPAGAKPLWFLGESLKKLSTADVVFFAKGWENAGGCKIENACAIAYDMNVILAETE